MQVTRQSVHHQPRTQQTHSLPPTPSNSASINEKKEMQKASAEVTGRTQERPISSSKPPGSRLAIRFNGP